MEATEMSGEALAVIFGSSSTASTKYKSKSQFVPSLLSLLPMEACTTLAFDL